MPTPPPAEPVPAGEAPVVLTADAHPPPAPADLAALRARGQDWPAAPPAPLPVDPVAVAARGWRDDPTSGRFAIVARHGAVDELREDDPARPPALARLRRALLGPPLEESAIVQERLSKRVALGILASDALSSVAYGPEAMLLVLVLAGAAGLSLALPIAGAILVLVVAVTVSYRQTIRAYPRGGGSYVVAGDNLGPSAGLLAAAGLMVDYVLTVAVSVSSGVTALTAAVPGARPVATLLCVAVIAALLFGNLRGVRQAGRLFSLPTYAFLAAMALVLGVGLAQAIGGDGAPGAAPDPAATQALTVLLVLRAFGSGATAMTGIEAIADGVAVFKPVEWRQARRTLTVMAGLLVVLFAGIVALARERGVVPAADTTVLAQLAQGTVGDGALYAFVQAATALVLVLAANTAFSDFPRLLFFLARDGNAPRAFLHMGDRLAFSNGIAALAVAAGVLVVAFDADTHALIPLYAVGVFLAFTLSQLGMVQHWRRRRGHGWRRGLTANAVGATLAGVVLLVELGTKFTQGAWVVVLLVAALVLAARAVHRHHVRVAAATSPVVSGDGEPASAQPGAVETLCVVLVAALDLPSLRALAYAATLGQPVLAVHLAPDGIERERFLQAWEAWGDHVRLEVVDSPYRAEVAPLAAYVRALHDERPGMVLTVVMAELVVPGWRGLLGGRVGRRVRRALRDRPDLVVTTVPFHVR